MLRKAVIFASLTTSMSVFGEPDMASTVYDGLKYTAVGKKIEKKVDRAIVWTGIDKDYAATTLTIADMLANKRIFYKNTIISVSDDRILVLFKKSY